MKSRPPPETCPVCGEDVPRKAKACPECGADYESGWKDNAEVYDGADIPDYGYEDAEKFGHEKWRAREAGPTRQPGILHPVWKLIALGLIVLLIAWSLRR